MKISIAKPVPPIQVAIADGVVQKTSNGFSLTFADPNGVHRWADPGDTITVPGGDGSLVGVVQSVTRHASGDGIMVTVEAKTTA